MNLASQACRATSNVYAARVENSLSDVGPATPQRSACERTKQMVKQTNWVAKRVASQPVNQTASQPASLTCGGGVLVGGVLCSVSCLR